MNGTIVLSRVKLLPFVTAPSCQATSPVALIKADNDSDVEAALKKAEELARIFVALVEPALIVNCGKNVTVQELPEVGLQEVVVALPKIALVLESIKSTLNAVEPLETAKPVNLIDTVPRTAWKAEFAVQLMVARSSTATLVRAEAEPNKLLAKVNLVLATVCAVPPAVPETVAD